MALTNWSNVTDWGGLMAVPNDNTGSWFWTIILYFVFIITVLLNISWGFETALLTASFISLILGLFLAFAGLVSWTWVLTFVGVMVIMFLYIGYTSRKYG